VTRGVAPGVPRRRPAPELRRRALRGGEFTGDARKFATGHRFVRFCLRSNTDGAARRVVAVAQPDLAGIGAGDEQRRQRVRVLDGDGATA